MLICHRFHVGPMAAPYTISSVPSSENTSVVMPKKPTYSGPTQKSK